MVNTPKDGKYSLSTDDGYGVGNFGAFVPGVSVLNGSSWEVYDNNTVISGNIEFGIMNVTSSLNCSRMKASAPSLSSLA